MIKTTSDFVAHAVTSGPRHHFFGYYGIQPWDATGQYLLCLEVPFQDRPPEAKDKAIVGMVDLSSSKLIPLAETRAWNFQQGAMMHWLPSAPDSKIIFNDRQGDRFVSVILNVHTGERRVLPKPISAMSHDGKTALSLNFARLQWTRPGYGYAGIDDPFAGECHPAEDGIYLIDLENGEDRRLVSMADVFASHGKLKEMKNHAVWFNHTLYNIDDSRFVFLIRWRTFLFPKWVRLWRLKKLWRLKTAMFTANVDGSDLRCVIDYGMVSHFDWRNSSEILVWANVKGYGNKFYLVSDGKNELRTVGERFLTQDGHCSFSPNGRGILTDTYPDRNHYRTLKILIWEEGREVVLGRYYSLPQFIGEIRCDLHPRWNRTGTQVCFDSVHEGSRQLYVIDVSNLVTSEN